MRNAKNNEIKPIENRINYCFGHGEYEYSVELFKLDNKVWSIHVNDRGECRIIYIVDGLSSDAEKLFSSINNELRWRHDYARFHKEEI